ncbi:DUF998 domain-containing protein [Mycobacterium asiaticum]|uniref:DUF998 domain-containing protein n=1 Tax=Mycobacterium asiaticum TaxID=1790 RepID=A0A1A3MU23_MYCAS|nr:DUF998 domain-containing protein [Mycobacterium asiaticum]OBK12580.1 hypothetical protein A5636_11205 [Mycobacterium asiaticum]
MAVPQRARLVPSTGQQRRAPLRWVVILGVVIGAVLYSNWVLEVVFTRTLPDPDLYISELAAADQPYGEWFRACDLASAAVLLAATAAALVGLRGGKWSQRGWWALGMFAVATAVDSTVWRLVCAPSSDAGCAAREGSRTVPIGHQLHWLSSGVVLTAAVASLFAFVMADSREGAAPRTRRLGRFMLGALIGTAVLTGVAILIDSADVIGVVGIAQRAELVAFAGWLIYVALRTARAPTETDS